MPRRKIKLFFILTTTGLFPNTTVPVGTGTIKRKHTVLLPAGAQVPAVPFLLVLYVQVVPPVQIRC